MHPADSRHSHKLLRKMDEKNTLGSRKEMDSHHTSQVKPHTACTRPPGGSTGPHPSLHACEQRETSGEGRVLELPADPALSLPSPCTSMCLQKEWKLGRLERRAQSRVGSRDKLLPFCSVGITPKR